MTHFFRRWSRLGSACLAPGLPMLVASPVVVETDTLNLVLTIVLLVICLGIHESAHAWVAWKCGDPTAKDLGRITLNPLVHIDPFMTIILPVVMFLTIGRTFGGAKPVPVSFHRLRHPWRDMSLVALAGPASNFVLAILFMIGWKFFVQTGLYNGSSETMLQRYDDLLPAVLWNAVYFNILLTLFNLIPIPPLDGSRVMAWLLPPPMRQPYVAVGAYGMWLVMLLATWTPAFRVFLVETAGDIAQQILRMVSLGGVW